MAPTLSFVPDNHSLQHLLAELVEEPSACYWRPHTVRLENRISRVYAFMVAISQAAAT